MHVVNRISSLFGYLRRRFAWLGVLMLSLGVAVAVILTRPSAAPLQRVETAWPVSVMPARLTDLSPQYFAFGKVESRQLASLKTTISAPVSAVYRHEGEWVEAGELVIQLDATEAELAFNIARASYQRNLAQLQSVETDGQLARNLVAEYQELKNIADTRLQRLRDMHGRGMVSDAELDAARQEFTEKSIQLEQHLAAVEDFPNRIAQQQANVDEAEAFMEKARIDLAQTRIEAPFAGRVISTEVTQGDRVMAGMPLVQIADYAELEIRTSVPAKTAGVLREVIERGEPIHATGELDGRPVRFPLVRLAADVKPGQSGIDAFFSSDPRASVDIGRTLQLAITLPVASQVFPMPVHALYQDRTLYKVVENRLQAVRYEEAGDYLDGEGKFNVLVRSAQVADGDLLMISQLPRAITGLLVEPIEIAEGLENQNFN